MELQVDLNAYNSELIVVARAGTYMLCHSPLRWLAGSSFVTVWPDPMLVSCSAQRKLALTQTRRSAYPRECQRRCSP